MNRAAPSGAGLVFFRRARSGARYEKYLSPISVFVTDDPF